MNRELPDVQAGFRKDRGTRDQIANIRWIIKKAREFQKTSTSASLTMLKPLTVWITTNCGTFWKRWKYQTTLPASCKIFMPVKKQELDMDTGLVQNWKGEHQVCILSPCLFNLYTEYIMWDTGLDEAEASRLPGEISIALDMQMTPPSWHKAKEN